MRSRASVACSRPGGSRPSSGRSHEGGDGQDTRATCRADHCPPAWNPPGARPCARRRGGNRAHGRCPGATHRPRPDRGRCRPHAIRRAWPRPLRRGGAAVRQRRVRLHPAAVRPPLRCRPTPSSEGGAARHRRQRHRAPVDAPRGARGPGGPGLGGVERADRLRGRPRGRPRARRHSVLSRPPASLHGPGADRLHRGGVAPRAPGRARRVAGARSLHRSLRPRVDDMEPLLSVIVPARNEEALVGATIERILAAVSELCAIRVGALHLATMPAEVLVVDDGSRDRTAAVVARYVERHGVRLIRTRRRGAASARNAGAASARGRVFCFVDADTQIPRDTLTRIRAHCELAGVEGGFTALAPLEDRVAARWWWTFWSHVRRLPMPRAKAMAAVMFCTRDVFDEFGPFAEDVVLGEEWPILAGLYRARPARFLYDRTLVAHTSSRRMELQPFGYVRTLARYACAVVWPRARTVYPHRFRHRIASPLA